MLTLTPAPVLATVVDEPAPSAGLRPVRPAIIASFLCNLIMVARDRDGEYHVMVSEACFTKPEVALVVARRLERAIADDILDGVEGDP